VPLNSLRIGLLTDNYPYTGDAPSSPPGGIGTYTQLVAEELAHRGHSVHVFTFAAVRRHRTIVHNGVAIWQCPPWSKRREMKPSQALEFTFRCRNESVLLNRYSMLCAGREAVRDGRFDILEAADLGAMGEMMRDARMSRLYSVRLHCSTNFGVVPAAVEDLPVMKQAERRHALTAESLTAPSRYAVDMTQRVWHCDLSRAAVVGNPVVAVPRESVCEGNGSVVFFGRLGWQKGVDLLVEAVGMLRAKVPNIKLKLIGPDQPWPNGRMAIKYLTEVAACSGIADCVEFAKPLPHGLLRDELRRHALVALPSRDETFGNVAIEAMMWSVPCVLSDIPPLREIGTHGEDCLMSASGDVLSLAENMGRLIGDNRLRQQLADGGFHRAQTWRVDRVVDSLFQAWGSTPARGAA